MNPIRLYLILAIITALHSSSKGDEIFVAADGRPDAAGSMDAPTSFLTAIKRASNLLKEKGLPKEGLTITLLAGRYDFRAPFVLGSEFQGSEDRPIVIQAAPGATVVFDGSKPIDAQKFRELTDPEERSRIASGSVDQVLATTITDPLVIKRFNENLILDLIIQSKSYLPSVFPNSGYASLKVETESPEKFPPGIPVGQEAYAVRAGVSKYQMPGKPDGWRGTLSEPMGARVGFARRANEMAGTWEQWERELARNNSRNQIKGFLEATWLLSAQPIVSASAADECIQLSRVLGYGWGWRKDKPFRVFGMLCELDQPGEWHFDPMTNRLFVHPPAPIDSLSKVSVPVATGFLWLRNTRYVSVIGLQVKNVASGRVIKITEGSHNLIAGCSIENCSATGVDINGKLNTVKSCDLVDLNQHVRLSGGRRSAQEITEGGNRVENCHIYQRNYRHQKVNVGMGGVGNHFVHNLVHNSLGQAMTVSGNDHQVEKNEFFNVGYDEGDGGAVYSGADMTGYGNTYRHNFFHHLMHVAGKVPRAGIHFDDHQAGSICIGNVFFKSAQKGIFYNGGAGHVAEDNVFLEGDLGIYNVANTKSYQRQKSILSDPARANETSKENYVGRAELVVGEDGWMGSLWGDRYPVFKKVMSDDSDSGRMFPIHCEIKSNYYFGNRKKGKTYFGRANKKILSKNTIENDREILPSDFVNYSNLNFKIVSNPNKPLPKIPFEEIGLFFDEYRSQMPDKAHYRSEIRKFFDGVISMAGTEKRIDTAKLVEEKILERPENVGGE